MRQKEAFFKYVLPPTIRKNWSRVSNEVDVVIHVQAKQTRPKKEINKKRNDNREIYLHKLDGRNRCMRFQLHAKQTGREKG